MSGRGREALIEFQRVGAYLKATAIDAETLVEVTSMGPPDAKEQLRRTVLAKLDYVLSKRGSAR